MPKLRLYQRIFNFNQYERDRWMNARAQAIPPQSRVLDIGAGTCPYRGLFSHCIYHTQDFARLTDDQLTAYAGYGQIDHVSDILSIPVENESYDAIVCTEVLEHVPEPIRAVQEFARILRPGGKLLLTAPLGSGIHQVPYHYYGGFTPYWYEKFLAESGFSDIEIHANGGFFKHFGQESIRFAKMSMPGELKAGPAWRIAWPIVWCMLLPILLVFLPVVCHFLDPWLDPSRSFTVGYHVSAIKPDRGRK